MPYNLDSPTRIGEPVKLKDPFGWFTDEVEQVGNHAQREVLKIVAKNLESFVRWPAEALLLCPEWDRTPVAVGKMKYFQYPHHVRHLAREKSVRLDGRPNGPAIAAFLLAGGERPARSGSSNDWSIHHLYSGKFPYAGRESTTHATKQPSHFTQSAGLIAAHPIADAMVDEFPAFTWLLRADAFHRFGYDPDRVFTEKHDELGFAADRPCRVVEVPVFMGSGPRPPGDPGMTEFLE